MDKHSLAEEAVKLLASLGRTPEAVAEALRSAGVKGRRRKPWCCPLSEWLRQRLAGVRQAFVQHDSAHLYGPLGVPWLYAPVVLPEPCRGFVRGHDEGRYPFLDVRATAAV